MENYYVKNEMDKSLEYEDYLEIAEKQRKKLNQRNIEHTEFLCWILEQQNWEDDIVIIESDEYNRFMESDIEDDEMNMVIVKSEEFYKEFKNISNVDIMDENNFVSMTYIERNTCKLTIKSNNEIKEYIIDIA